MSEKKATKGSWMRQARELLEERQRTLAVKRKLQAEYQAMLEQNQPTIDTLSAQADALANAFRCHFSESQEAYTDGDRELAKELSEQGHREEDYCRLLNGQANALRRQLRCQLDEITALGHKADELKGQAEHYTRAGSEVRKTHVERFTSNAAMTDEEVEDFLDTLPQVIFHKVASIEFAGAVYGDGLYADVKAKARGDWTREGKLKIQVGNLCSTKEDIKRAIAHELGHVVYQYFLSAELRAEWYAYHAETKPGSFATLEALQNEEEDFAECFSLFAVRPDLLRAKDKTKYAFIAKQFKDLSTRK